MQFANPWFLLGISAIAIPIIIHLFNFRRFRKVYFTNVRFIEELKLQTRKQSKLKHLLVLLSRILAIICLVLAFAQPFKPLNKQLVHQHARDAVSVYVDNSYSMEARSSKGNLLEEAKSKAKEVFSAFKSADLFQVLTGDFEGKHQRFLTRDETNEAIAEIKLSPATRLLSEVIKRQQDILTTTGDANKDIFIVSDFQKSTTDLLNLKKDTGISVFFIPVLANQSGNLYIDSCWFDNPVQQLDQQATLRVRIKNTAGSDQEKIPVKLMINKNQRAVASFNCPSHGECEVALSFTNNETGIHHAYLEIVDYPITYDDRYYFTFQVFNTIPVMCINEKDRNRYLDNLFGKDSSFVYSVNLMKSLDYSSINNYRLLIINEIEQFSSGFLQELKGFLDKGGSVLVIPPAHMEPDSYRNFLSAFNLGIFTKTDTVNSNVMKLDAAHGLYRDVFDKIPENLDLPVILSHYPLVFPAKSGAEVLLRMVNDDPFLVSFQGGKGKIYLLTSPLRPEYNNFGKHLLFVPTLYKIALLSQPYARLAYTIGQDEPVEISSAVDKGDEVYKIRKVGEAFEFIPESRIMGSRMVFLPHDQVREAGNYSVMDGTKEIAGISFNFDRRESAMDFYTPEELKSLVAKTGLKNVTVLNVKEKPVSMVIEDLNKGIRFWKLFVVLALLFLAAEVLILRYWRHA